MRKQKSHFTENEIRPVHLMDGQMDRYMNDVRRLLRYRDDFVIVPCPACQSTRNRPCFLKYDFQFVVCDDCQTIYANPRPCPVHLSEYYRESENYAYWNKYIFPASEAVRLERIFKPRVEMVLEICRRRGIAGNLLVEVGAGFGLFCQEMRARGYFKRVVAIEPTPDLSQTCRQRGIETIEKPVEEVGLLDLLKTEKMVDVVANFEVIEHLFSPGEFIGKCSELLSPGGMLILTCPNGKGFDIAVLGAVSPAVDTEHLNLFNPESLSGLLERHGFEVIERRTPGRLDAEIVRNKVLAGEADLSEQLFLKEILIDRWEEKGEAFQNFLVEQGMSSNMLIAAVKK